MKCGTIKQNLKKALNALLRRRPYHLDKTVSLRGRRDLIQIGRGSKLCDYTILQVTRGPITIGCFVQINAFTVILSGSGVSIGDYVMIAPHCTLAAGNHDYHQTDVPMRLAGSISKGPIVIEDNVWIGANCTVTDGVRIGRGAVVGANSVVTRDVEPYKIVAGTPAGVIGDRRDGSRIEGICDHEHSWNKKSVDTQRVA